MNLPAILDIVIALIFIYLILSLLASEIQEIIAAYLKWRATNLREATEILLGRVVQSGEITNTKRQNQISKEKLVPTEEKKLSQLSDIVPPEESTNPNKLDQLPAITTKTEEVDVKTAITLVNELYQTSLIKSVNQTTLGRFTRSSRIGPSYISSETFASALLEILKFDDVIQEFRKNKQFDKSIFEIVEKINCSNLPSNLKENLTILAKRAQRKTQNIDEQIYQFEQEIETWFNRSMERASGVYKRNAKGFAILLGSLISVGANADTLHIFSMLSKDTVLSAGISQYANQTVQNCKKENLLSNEYLNCVSSQVNNNELSKLSLPIGWNFPLETPKSFLTGLGIVILKFIGWLLTGIAISMGASFWFDLLNRFINVRYAGKKPTSSNEKPDSSV